MVGWRKKICRASSKLTRGLEVTLLDFLFKKNFLKKLYCDRNIQCGAPKADCSLRMTRMPDIEVRFSTDLSFLHEQRRSWLHMRSTKVGQIKSSRQYFRDYAGCAQRKI